MMFEERCCDKCVKASRLTAYGLYTNSDQNNMPNRCAIQRDIYTRMCCDDPISERTIKICDDFIMKGIVCPFIKTEWPQRKRRIRVSKEQMKLEL